MNAKLVTKQVRECGNKGDMCFWKMSLEAYDGPSSTYYISNEAQSVQNERDYK